VPAQIPSLFWLAVGWTAWFAVHSLLASLPVKRAVAARWPALMPGYRLAFNAFALLSILPLLWATFALGGPPVIAWRGGAAWVAHGLTLLALGLFLWSLRCYDSAEFFGLRQWRRRVRSVEDQERLHISPLHRYVRHPWYGIGLLLLWSRDLDSAQLLASGLATGYFVIGSRLEERKLIAYHGDRYRRYRERVPALVPLPWRYLRAAEAAALLAETAAPPQPSPNGDPS
jgi:methanethiol S-methyltransferase